MSLRVCFNTLSNAYISKILMTILDLDKDNYAAKSNNVTEV